MSKYSEKKERQAETGTVGYITGDEPTVEAVTKQPEAKRGGNAPKGGDKDAARECLRGILTAFAEIEKRAEVAHELITRMKVFAKGAFKGDVLSLEGLTVSASMKFNSAFAKANTMAKD